VLGSSDHRSHQAETAATGARPGDPVAQVSDSIADERLGKAVQLSNDYFAYDPVGKRCPIHVHHLDNLNIIVEMQCSWALRTLPRCRTDFHGGVHVERTHSKSFLAEPPTTVTQRHSAAVD